MSHINRYPTPAHTYYVDNTNGLDTNRGDSEDAPWQTIAKINGATFRPGDRVLFKRGETFADKLVPPRSGSASQCIMFGAYGSGVRPIISRGSDSNALDITNTIHYLRFGSIDFSGATGDDTSAVRANSSYLYFYDCIFRDAAGATSGCFGFSAYSVGGGDIHHIIVDTCTGTDNAASGFFSGSDTGVGGPHDVLFVSCIAYDNGDTAYADHGFYVKYGVTVRNCTAYNNTFGAGIKTNDQGVFGSAYYPIVEGCTVYGNLLGFICDHEYSVYFNNVSYGNTSGGVSISEGHCKFYFNTFVNNGYGQIRFEFVPDNCDFKNNLFISDAAVITARCYLSYDPITLDNVQAGNTFDYNVLYKDGNSATAIAHTYNTNLYTFAQWQALSNSPDPNGTLLSALPGFVTRYTDLHPADGGNLKGLGVAITGYETDKDGHTRADPPTPGCYEESS